MMRRLIIAITICLTTFAANGQWTYPIGTATWYKKVRVDSVFWLNTVDTVHNYAVLYPGALMSRTTDGDTSLYLANGSRWVRIGSGAAGGGTIDSAYRSNDTLFLRYASGGTLPIKYPGKVVPDIVALGSLAGQPGDIAIVADNVRGGAFYYTAGGTANDITVFDAPIGYWNRVYDASNGILIDWAGADPSGVSNSSPAIQAAINFSNHICARAGGNYLLEDSITISDKTNFVLDGKGATFTEAESFYSTLAVKNCPKLVIKDLNFDGPENYTYFLTSDPSSAKQYLYIDSSDIVTVTRILGQNKRGLITFSSCSNVNLDGWAQDGIFKNGVASNVLGSFGVRTVGYGFVDPTHYLPFGCIKNGKARNTGSGILVGDNTTYVSITDNTFDSTYNNGIYVSSALWATVKGNTMRKVGGTGIKARGLGFTITGNVVTNSDLGISVSGNNIEAFYASIPTKYGSNGYSTVVSDNVVDSVTTRGIDVDFQDGFATHNTTIANNIIRYNSSVSDYLLKVNTVGGTQILGNKIQGSAASIASYFQLSATDSTVQNIIANNVFRDCVGQAMHFNGLKRSKVTDNVFDSIGTTALVFENSRSVKIDHNDYVRGNVVNATSANGNTDLWIENNWGNITADNLTSILMNNYPLAAQNITGTPRMAGQITVSGGNVYLSNGFASSANWLPMTPATRTITIAGTSPVVSSAGAQDFTTNRTWTISMSQANTSTNGWLSSTDWNTFNNKAAGNQDVDYIWNNNSTDQSANGRISGTLTAAGGFVSKAAPGTMAFVWQNAAGSLRWNARGETVESGDQGFDLTFNDYTASGTTTNNVVIFKRGVKRYGFGTANPLTTLHAQDTSTAAYSSTSVSLTTPVGVKYRVANNSNTDNSFSGYEWSVNNSSSNNQLAYFGAVANTGAGAVIPDIVIGHKIGATSYSEVMRISAAGNLGINNTAPASTLDVSGSAGFNIATITGATTLDVTHHTVLVNNSSNIAITLPAASVCTRRIYVIKKISNNANTVTITANGAELIDDTNTKVISTQWESKTIQSNGTQWYIQ